jgi:membrane protein
MADELDDQLSVPDSSAFEDDPEARSTQSSGSSGLIARSRRQASQIFEKLEQQRLDSRVVDAGFIVLARDRLFPTSLLAGALVSRIIIYVIPFLLFLIFAVGLFADVAGTSPEEAARQAGMAGLFAQATSDATSVSDEWRVATIVLTLVAVLWAADGVARSLIRVFAVVWQVRSQRRRWRWTLPFAVIGFSLLALASSRATLGQQGSSALSVVVQLAFEFLAIGGLWMLATRGLPHDPAATSWRYFLPGSVIMAVVFLAAKLATVLYFAPQSVAYSEKYGSIGIVLIMLSWAYLISYATVASADADAAAFRTRRVRSGPTE